MKGFYHFLSVIFQAVRIEIEGDRVVEVLIGWNTGALGI